MVAGMINLERDFFFMSCYNWSMKWSVRKKRKESISVLTLITQRLQNLLLIFVIFDLASPEKLSPSNRYSSSSISLLVFLFPTSPSLFSSLKLCCFYCFLTDKRWWACDRLLHPCEEEATHPSLTSNDRREPDAIKFMQGWESSLMTLFFLLRDFFCKGKNFSLFFLVSCLSCMLFLRDFFYFFPLFLTFFLQQKSQEQVGKTSLEPTHVILLIHI